MEVSHWRCPFARAVACAVAIALLPLPALAGENHTTAASPQPLTASVAKIAARAAQPAPARIQAREAQAGQADVSTPSFFKTPVGIAVIAVFAAGTGYAIYSSKQDRIKSPGR